MLCFSVFLFIFSLFCGFVILSVIIVFTAVKPIASLGTNTVLLDLMCLRLVMETAESVVNYNWNTLLLKGIMKPMLFIQPGTNHNLPQGILQSEQQKQTKKKTLRRKKGV